MQVLVTIIKILQKTIAQAGFLSLPTALANNDAFGVLRESARDSLDAPFDDLINKIKAH